MKINLKQLLGLSLLAVAGGAQATCSSSSTSCSSATLDKDLTGTTCTPTTKDNLMYGQTFFALRPQGSNLAREQLGTAGRVHEFARHDFHGNISLALEWQQSSNEAELGSAFFFNGTNSMKYGPNWTPNDNTEKVDVNSLNFGTTASGTIAAKPRVQNLVADLQIFMGWDEFVSGLWTKIGVPINYVRTDMRLEDTVSTKVADATSTGKFLRGDVSTATTTDVPYANLADAWAGNKAAGALPVMTYGKISGRRSETRVAGLSFDLGYDFLRREEGHMGLSLRAVAPTGNCPCPEFLFDAVSGANNCWELGLGMSGAYELWRDSDNSNLNFYTNTNITHVGRRAQRRLLGLKNIASAPGASWLALKKITSASDATYVSMERAANKLGLVVKIGSRLMIDAATSLKYNWDNYGFAIGYNFWARSKETASAREKSVFDTSYYVLKEASGNTGNTTSLSSSDTTAALKTQTSIAQAGTTTTLSTAALITANKINDDDVDVCPALHPAARSHKVFGSIEYNWSDNEWAPYLLLGGSYEVGCKANKIKNSSVNQWGVMAKGGIAF